MDDTQVQAELRVTDKLIEALTLRVQDLEQWLQETEDRLARFEAREAVSRRRSATLLDLASNDVDPRVRRFTGNLERLL